MLAMIFNDKSSFIVLQAAREQRQAKMLERLEKQERLNQAKETASPEQVCEDLTLSPNRTDLSLKVSKRILCIPPYVINAIYSTVET